MELEVIKNLIKKYTAGHGDFLQKATTADQYYRNKTDIIRQLPKKRDEVEEGQNPLRNADNRIPFNFHGLLVNQKASYMFAAPPLFDLGDKAANKKLTAFLGDKYAKTCKDLCVEASNASVAWLHLWRDKATQQYKYAIVPSGQVIPVWSNNLEKELKGVLRCYHDITDDGKDLDVYEYWNDTACQAYAIEAGSTVDTGLMPYNSFTLIDTSGNSNLVNEFKHEIGEVPFFPFFNNNIDTGDLENIKPLIDVYCKVFSGFVNDLEDIQEVIFVLTNYGGADLKQFLQELKDYKAIQVEGEGGEDKSGVSTLTIELPVEARKELLTTTRKCIFEQGQGIDPDPQNFGNSSGVALGFLYSLLELKSGLMETEFKLGFGQFIRCVCRLLDIKIKDNTIVQTWTRTSVKNDAEIASICSQSKGVISDETIVAHHPYVEDAEKEMEILNKQKEEEAEAQREISDMFPKQEEDLKEGEGDE
ncbi:phage portal protein [Hungatella sp. L12]|uniref:Phage portal protein n=1 Tax=Hungatella hominis TaxID=2763050 RepID=A0ABR7HH18_9FIRM|nr:phage portal protein [Hungatella hominis]MBC5712477.1 phage portal protein [Hungatella hominis]